MTILFLHGWQSTPGGPEPTHLEKHGHEVLNPALPDDDFDAAVRIAQAEFDQHHPDVVVGSSRGGAVAMNIDSGVTPLVLLCPAWKRWGTATKVKPGTTIIHSDNDEMVPYSDSEELAHNSGLPDDSLWDAVSDYELVRVMLNQCESSDTPFQAIHESAHALVGYRLGLTPKEIVVGTTSTGTSGGIAFCSRTAVYRDPARYLMIAVAGKVGTQVLGYRNWLVSENLAELPDDEEPGWGSDEMLVWDDYSLEGVQNAEAKVRKILERGRSVLAALAEALTAKGKLGKDEIRRILGKSGRNR
jgi:hypothetical protein